MEAINCLEHELHRLSLALCPSAPPEPLDDVLQQYMETLCSAPKQTNFVNTLIQNIPTFNGSKSMQLEDSDIHTSVSCFMDVQQKGKESLAAYIYRFKREAKRCNFTNNVARIRIFVKGLKNTHTLAAFVYEKGPQTQADAISEVEKLQAVQQLIATLLLLSAVNAMSNEGDQCLQWQELGHITHHCLNVCCFECNEYGHTAADLPDRIPPSGTHAHHKRQHSNTRHHARSTSRHHQDRHRHSRLRSQSSSHRYQSQGHNNLHRGCSRSHHRCHQRSTS